MAKRARVEGSGAGVKSAKLIVSLSASTREKSKFRGPNVCFTLLSDASSAKLPVRVNKYWFAPSGAKGMCVRQSPMKHTVGKRPLHLTNKEYGILELLSLRKGATLSKEAFLNHMYGGMDEPGAKVIDVFMCKLRKKLAAATVGVDYIKTVWGQGYVLRDPPAETAGARATAAGAPVRVAA